MQTRVVPTPAPRPARTHDLSALAALDGASLGALYGTGRVPASLHALDGHPRGRMLAVRGLDRGLSFAALRALAGAGAFPWGGKSFAASGPGSGSGVNRVHLGGRHRLFPFLARLGASVVDGRPAVILDYDLGDNPGFIRAIHDEVRLVADGLYLGPAMWKARRGPVHVLWFALDTRDQAAPVGERA